jgi:RNA polymerase sigma-70 factor (ECF subfamily)
VSEASLEALRAGDESAFREVVGEHQSVLMRLALIYSPSRAVAEEAVQETWLAALRAIDQFEGRSSLRTWLCRILINIARRGAKREQRSTPFSSWEGAADDGPPAVDPARFHQDGLYAGHWVSFPLDPGGLPEQRVLSAEVRAGITAAVETLRPRQREVFVLRDVEGWSSEEVSAALDLTAGYQRVLLHRARSQLRQCLEDLLGPDL